MKVFNHRDQQKLLDFTAFSNDCSHNRSEFGAQLVLTSHDRRYS